MATVSKTLRLPDDVVRVVETFPGDNFSAKFIAAVRLLGLQHEQLTADILMLETRKRRLLQDVYDLQTIETKKHNIAGQLGDISWKVSECRKLVSTYLEVVQAVTGPDAEDK